MKKIWVIVGIIIVVLGGGLILRGLILNRSIAEDSIQSTGQIINPRMVMTIRKEELQKTVSASGYLEPQEEKNLYFSLNGKIEKIMVAEGERVHAGEELMQLDKSQQELNYLKAKNDYDTARINGSASQIKEQELNLKVAKDNLEATTLRAPFSGLITDVAKKEGDYITNGQVVATLIDDEGYKIEVNVDESDIRLVKIGQQVLISLDALPGQKFKGEVTQISYQAKNTNGIITLPVTVELKEINQLFRPGFSAELEIIVDTAKDQLLVPVTAVFNRNGQERVIKVVDGKPVPTPVKIGISNGVQVVIEEGLTPGDQILINTYEYAGINPANNMNFFMGPGGNGSNKSPARRGGF